MTHWHITSSNGGNVAFGILRYDNCAKSISDYVDLVYNVFPGMVDEDNRNQYSVGMLKVAEEESSYCIYTASKKLTLYWTGCDDDPCTFSLYN